MFRSVFVCTTLYVIVEARARERESEAAGTRECWYECVCTWAGPLTLFSSYEKGNLRKYTDTGGVSVWVRMARRRKNQKNEREKEQQQQQQNQKLHAVCAPTYACVYFKSCFNFFDVVVFD